MTSPMFSDTTRDGYTVPNDEYQAGILVDLGSDEDEYVEDEATPEPEPEPVPAVVDIGEDPVVEDTEGSLVETPVVEEEPPAKKPRAARKRATVPDKCLSDGVEKTYSTDDVAKHFFGKSTQWLYWGLKKKNAKGEPIQPVFVYKDGTPIEAQKIGKGNRARYTLPIIREMAYSCYRRGNLKEDELRAVLARIHEAEEDVLV